MSQIAYSFVKCGCSIYCFPHSLNSDICRSTDISKCFSESLGIRDNGSRLYITHWSLLRCASGDCQMIALKICITTI